MVDTIRMVREDGKTADVHPDMVEEYRAGGFDLAANIKIAVGGEVYDPRVERAVKAAVAKPAPKRKGK